MNTFAPLTTTLLDLAYALRKTSIPLTIGGGFGLHLKQEHLRQSGERTLLDRLPESRATNDIDLFLRVDVLASLATMQQVPALSAVSASMWSKTRSISSGSGC